MSEKIDKIVSRNLCLGCGLCEAMDPLNTSMQLKPNGFFEPSHKLPLVKSKANEILKICPGINIQNDLIFDQSQGVWGKVYNLYSAYSTDSEIRTKGSSGGIISAIAIYLLEEKLVDSVLQVGYDSADYKKNQLQISKTKQEVLNCATSRYAPVSIFKDIFTILESSEDKFCFIGKPCDISGLKNVLQYYPQYRDRFVYYISIVCAGMPSFNATDKLIDSFNEIKKPISNLKYRGDGWPGFFSFTDDNKKKFQMTYNDSWGKVLGRHIHFRCKVCPDGIGLQADIAVGDAWSTHDGYPDFTEREGESLVLLRTSKASVLFDEMLKHKKVVYRPLEMSTIKQMQPFQYNRRMHVAARITALLIIKQQQLNFKNVRIWSNLLHSPILRSIREFLGTAKRLVLR